MENYIDDSFHTKKDARAKINVWTSHVSRNAISPLYRQLSRMEYQLFVVNCTIGKIHLNDQMWPHKTETEYDNKF